jgi:hypothetical protein
VLCCAWRACRAEASSIDTDGEGEGPDSGDEAEPAAGASPPSGALLHDPLKRLATRPHGHGHGHAHARLPPRGAGVAAANGAASAAARGEAAAAARRAAAGAAAMGSSYMSYASVSEATSHGEGLDSPYGLSPAMFDGGELLTRNPLGASPGAVAMSLGTPYGQSYMHQAARLVRR